MALFGATRPTGSATVTPSSGSGWMIESQETGYTYGGANQYLYGLNDSASGAVTFTWRVGNTQTPSISGIVVEFYLQSSGGVIPRSQSGGPSGNPVQGISSYGIWVGIGGLTGSTIYLWQAGIEYDSGTNFTAFWCAGSPKCSTGNTYYNNSFPIGWGDKIVITVTSGNGISSFTIQDLSEKLSWSYSESFSPYLYSGEWIEEPMEAGAGSPVTFFSLELNGAAASMVGSYIGDYNRLGVTPLSLYESAPEFSVGAQF